MLMLLRYLWALPTTAIGLIFTGVALLTGGHAQVDRGILKVWGGWTGRQLQRWGGTAITFGHVVLGYNRALLFVDWIDRHERVHVRQVERWGMFYLPAYGIATLIAKARGRHPYLGNVFEAEAFRGEPWT